MTEWVRGLPAIWKIAVTAGGIFVAGLGLGGWGLVTDVAENTKTIEGVEKDVATLTHESDDHSEKLDRIICLLKLEEGASALSCEG